MKDLLAWFPHRDNSTEKKGPRCIVAASGPSMTRPSCSWNAGCRTVSSAVASGQ